MTSIAWAIVIASIITVDTIQTIHFGTDWKGMPVAAGMFVVCFAMMLISTFRELSNGR